MFEKLDIHIQKKEIGSVTYTTCKNGNFSQSPNESTEYYGF